MIISEFLTSPQRLDVTRDPEIDALTEVEALEEAAFFDLRFNAVDSSVWLLFDCKGALSVRAGNTAIVVITFVELLEWTCPNPKRPWWWTVWGWSPSISDDRIVIEFSHEGANFRARGSAAEFFVGDVPGGDEAPPNFTSATDEEVRRGLAQWYSPFTPIHASFLNVDAG